MHLSPTSKLGYLSFKDRCHITVVVGETIWELQRGARPAPGSVPLEPRFIKRFQV